MTEVGAHQVGGHNLRAEPVMFHILVSHPTGDMASSQLDKHNLELGKVSLTEVKVLWEEKLENLRRCLRQITCKY